MKCLIAILTLLILTTCATKKGVDFCGTGLPSQKDWVGSRITDLRTSGVIDTTLAFLRGCVTGTSIRPDTTIMDTLSFAGVSYKPKVDIAGNGTMTDTVGRYALTLIAGTYDVAIDYPGFNTILIRNLALESGEIKELNVMLGQGYGTTEYLMIDKYQYKLLEEKNN